MERNPARVAIIPAGNNTDNPGAQIILDKAWETALRKAGFQIVNADSVVTFASAQAIPVGELQKTSTVKLGEELKVDYLLQNEIMAWGTKYRVLAEASVVACRSRLVEARTGATVWAHDWIFKRQGNNSGGGLAGMLLSATLNAIVATMTDETARIAVQGVTISSTTMPYPGIARETPREN